MARGFNVIGDKKSYDLLFWEKHINGLVSRAFRILQQSNYRKSNYQTLNSTQIFLGSIVLIENADNYEQFNDLLINKFEKFVEDIASILSKQQSNVYNYGSILKEPNRYNSKRLMSLYLKLSKTEMGIFGDIDFLVNNKLIRYYNDYWS